MRIIPIVNNEWYHLYNRGVSRQQIFHGPKDYQRFLQRMKAYKKRYQIQIMAYCLLPNHFHLLMRGKDTRCLSQQLSNDQDAAGGYTRYFPHLKENDRITEDNKKPKDTECQVGAFMHALQMSYSKYYNLKYDHSGAVWQGAYKAKLVKTDSYFLWLMHYIHQNPEKHGLVGNAKTWPYSSLPHLLKKHHDLITDEEIFPLDGSYREYYQEMKRYR